MSLYTTLLLSIYSASVLTFPIFWMVQVFNTSLQLRVYYYESFWSYPLAKLLVDKGATVHLKLTNENVVYIRYSVDSDAILFIVFDNIKNCSSNLKYFHFLTRELANLWYNTFWFPLILSPSFAFGQSPHSFTHTIKHSLTTLCILLNTLQQNTHSVHEITNFLFYLFPFNFPFIYSTNN